MTTDLPQDYALGSIPSEKEHLIDELRSLMTHVSGDDKCTLCKAISQLEKEPMPNNSGMAWNWLLVIMFLLFMPGLTSSDSKFDLTFLETALKNMKHDTEGVVQSESSEMSSNE